MTDLFPDLPPTLSPRLAWLTRYGLTLRRISESRYVCALDENTFGQGETEEEAICDFCVKTRMAHYNE